MTIGTGRSARSGRRSALVLLTVLSLIASGSVLVAAPANAQLPPGGIIIIIPVDTDNDGVPDYADNCLGTPNADQLNVDGDSQGDACDVDPSDGPLGDPDEDWIPNSQDNCPIDPNSGQENTDGERDGGDACDLDDDGDGIDDDLDNCSVVWNDAQADGDYDGVGDECDFYLDDGPLGDLDDDGELNVDDNCDEVSNPDQSDTDLDDIGDACDDDDGDGILDTADRCPGTPRTKIPAVNSEGCSEEQVAALPAPPAPPAPVFFHVLTVTKGGTGSGSVTTIPTAIACGTVCTAAFVSGSVVTLTPTADDGSTFAGWTGACTGSSTCVVSMTEARSVQALFTVKPEVLGSVESKTTLVLERVTNGLKVTSSSSHDICDHDRKVVFKKMRSGDDLGIGRRTTNNAGVAFVRPANRKGSYYVTALPDTRTTTDGLIVNCSAARSNTVTLEAPV